jgi:hypothetical protein
MKSALPALTFFLAKKAFAEYNPHAEPICNDIKLLIPVTAQNWDLPAYPNATDKGALLTYLTKTLPSSGFAGKPKKTVSGTFNIAATYCEPANKVPERENSIQFLLHGFGYTRVSLFSLPTIYLANERRLSGTVSTIPMPPSQANIPGSTTQPPRATQRSVSIISGPANLTTPTLWTSFNSHCSPKSCSTLYKASALQTSPRIFPRSSTTSSW